MTDSLVHWVALSLIPGLGGKTIHRLLAQFGSLEAILAANEADLRSVPRIGPKLAAAILAIDLDRTQAEMNVWIDQGISILQRDDEGYPAALRAVDDAPPILFWQGCAAGPESERAAAIVGTRQPSTESLQLAEQLAGALVADGWTVISGLAAGIDTAAHTGAVRAGGRTWAVLGSGLHMIYPPENTTLAEQIRGQGAVISEVHPASPPNSPALVARNRLISGLGRIIIVIESTETSGSMHAVRFARAQERQVYAVDNGSPGNSLLLAEGAFPLPREQSHWLDLFREGVE